MSVATQSSLIPVSSSALCSRLASRARSWICVLRYRVRFRSARIGLGGTKLARSSPASASWHSQAASETSVLRPGTCLTWRAFTSSSSNSSSRIAQTGFQYTPVASIVTCVHTDAPPASRASVRRPAHRRRELRHMLLATAALRPAPAHTRSPAPCAHQAPPGAQRSSPQPYLPGFDTTMIVAQGPRELTSLTGVLMATVRSSGETHTPN